MPISLDHLITTYRQYLAARITMAESPGFGGMVVEISKQTINAHKETEEMYLREKLGLRAAEVAELKAISKK